jgi:hypothetical protein
MNRSEKLELILKLALSAEAEPSEALNENIRKQIRERETMKPLRNKKMAVVLAAVIGTMLISATAFAALHFLSPKQVAERFGDQRLAEAFEGENAIEINKSVTSGGYIFTLLGITSGENLSGFQSTVQDLHPDRTYAVISITKQDGSPMPGISEEEYDRNPFIVTPLIKGQKPWQVNIVTMNGGYKECVIDGAMYRMIECDNIEMFADRGVYLYAGPGSFINNKTVDYDEKTGEISLGSGSKGPCALFDLPLDIKKADPAKAEEYLKELLGPEPDEDGNIDPAGRSTDETSPVQAGPANAETTGEDITESLIRADGGDIVPGSVKKVTYDEEGMICYTYEDESETIKGKSAPENLFRDGETDVWISGGRFNMDGEWVELQYYRDENGEITGRLVRTGEAIPDPE